MFRFIVVVCLNSFLITPAHAQDSTPLNARDRAAILEELAQTVDEQFFDEERAHAIAAEMRSADFSAASTHEAFAEAVSTLLHSHDNHFRVDYIGPAEVAMMMSGENDGQGGPQVDPFESSRRQNFGFQEVSILPGNIGYIDLREFAPADVAAETASAALDFVANTDAVIFDLRENGGGAPSMVQFLISHFLGSSDSVAINTFVSRRYDFPSQLNSLIYHPNGHRPDVPLYVLISGRTGSAGEAFPYHLQAMDRATIVGETSYGAGNPGDTFVLDSGYTIFVSTGSARNPITGTNWEGVGVAPDVAVDPSIALETAQLAALEQLAQTAEDDDLQASYRWAMELVRYGLGEYNAPAENPEQYAGTYGPRRVVLDSGDLFYTRDEQPLRAIHRIGEDRFLVEGYDDYRLTFRRNRRGEIISLALETLDRATSVSPRD